MKLVDSVKLESEITATANAIRGKTGLSDPIPWEDNTGFANAVAAITVGGGSSEDVRYVTFMNDDGTIEYGKKPTAVGDDCADPIARGVFDTPAKESTAQYNYTFGGWATTPGGGIDSNALASVTEDRTVYANFISVLRYYTITYYDSDGATVLKTESLAYGAMPEYAPKKEGFSFDGWSPEPIAVTGNAAYTAQWSELHGLVKVVTIPKTLFASSGTVRDAAISNDGKMFIAAIDELSSAPQVCQIQDGVASVINAAGILDYAIKHSKCEFGYDDTTFRLYGYNGTKYYDYDLLLDGTDITRKSYRTYMVRSIACSPVSDKTASCVFVSGTNYKLNCTGSPTLSTTTNFGKLAFSNDGRFLAAGSSSNGLEIYEPTEEAITLVHTVDSKTGSIYNISYNADGSMLAIACSQSPYVRVYETTNYTQVASFTDGLGYDPYSYCEFLGDDWLVMGRDTTVQAYVVNENGVQPFEYDLPEYSGGTIKGMKKNFADNRLIIWDSSSYEVWAKV